MKKFEPLKSHQIYREALDYFYSARSKPTDAQGALYSNLQWRALGSQMSADYGANQGSKDPRNVYDAINQGTINSLTIEASGVTSEVKVASGIPWYNIYVDGTITIKVPSQVTAGYVPPVLGDTAKTDNVVLQHLTQLLQLKSALDFRSQDSDGSKVRSRASLYFEERKTVLARKIAALLHGVQAGANMTEAIANIYLKINDVFDVSQLFYDTDTTEYSEALLMQGGPKARPNYPLHSAATGTVPMGASLGWRHQIDGDAKRDMFLNAPFAWACLPVRAGKEDDAIHFLKECEGFFKGIHETQANIQHLTRD